VLRIEQKEYSLDQELGGEHGPESGGVEGQKVTDVTSGHTAETSDARSDKRL
jgi:hypothetical protein